jgi:hypothetical protein
MAYTQPGTRALQKTAAAQKSSGKSPMHTSKRAQMQERRHRMHRVVVCLTFCTMTNEGVDAAKGNRERVRTQQAQTRARTNHPCTHANERKRKSGATACTAS